MGVEFEVVGVDVDHVIKSLSRTLQGKTANAGDETLILCAKGAPLCAVKLDDTCDAEVTTPPLPTDAIGLASLSRLAKALSSCNAQVSHRTATHMHWEANAFDGDAFSRLLALFVQHQTVLYSLVDKRRINFCKDISQDLVESWFQKPPATREDVVAIVQDWTRFLGINFKSLAKHGTVEFRFFDGTLNPTVLRRNYDITDALISKALSGSGLPPRPVCEPLKAATRSHIDAFAKAVNLRPQAHLALKENLSDGAKASLQRLRQRWELRALVEANSDGASYDRIQNHVSEITSKLIEQQDYGMQEWLLRLACSPAPNVRRASTDALILRAMPFLRRELSAGVDHKHWVRRFLCAKNPEIRRSAYDMFPALIHRMDVGWISFLWRCLNG